MYYIYKAKFFLKKAKKNPKKHGGNILKFSNSVILIFLDLMTQYLVILMLFIIHQSI